MGNGVFFSHLFFLVFPNIVNSFSFYGLSLVLPSLSSFLFCFKHISRPSRGQHRSQPVLADVTTLFNRCWQVSQKMLIHVGTCRQVRVQKWPETQAWLRRANGPGFPFQQNDQCKSNCSQQSIWSTQVHGPRGGATQSIQISFFVFPY